MPLPLIVICSFLVGGVALLVLYSLLLAIVSPISKCMWLEKVEESLHCEFRKEEMLQDETMRMYLTNPQCQIIYTRFSSGKEQIGFHFTADVLGHKEHMFLHFKAGKPWLWNNSPETTLARFSEKDKSKAANIRDRVLAMI